VGEFDDPLANNVGQWAAIHEDATQLVDAAMTCSRRMVH
jgi:hypothetical protein